MVIMAWCGVSRFFAISCLLLRAWIHVLLGCLAAYPYVCKQLSADRLWSVQDPARYLPLGRGLRNASPVVDMECICQVVPVLKQIVRSISVTMKANLKMIFGSLCDVTIYNCFSNLFCCLPPSVFHWVATISPNTFTPGRVTASFKIHFCRDAGTILPGGHIVEFFAVPPLCRRCHDIETRAGARSSRSLAYFLSSCPWSLPFTPVVC